MKSEISLTLTNENAGGEMSPTKTAPTPVTVVATIQAYRSSRNETLVPPGGPPSRVVGALMGYSLMYHLTMEY